MDSLCLRAGLHGITPAICACSNLEVRQNPSQFSASAGVRVPPAAGGIAVEKGGGDARFSFQYPFRSLFPGANHGAGEKGVAMDDAVLMECTECEQGNVDDGEEGGGGRREGVGDWKQSEAQDGNWVFKILHVRSLWSDQKDEEEEEKRGTVDQGNGSPPSPCSSSEACDCADDDDDENEIVFDRDSFSELLKKVSLSDAKLYAQLSYLGNLAYTIPTIKHGNRLRRHGLRYVTSSIEKREQLANANEELPSTNGEQQDRGPSESAQTEDVKNDGPRISASAAFRIAASAASYLNTHTRSIFRSSEDAVDQDVPEDGDKDREMASVKATTDSVTAVVAAKEEAKQAVADDLNSISSWPCEWYICDDEESAIRFFIIQGSESLASWQANLLFEPIQFEGLDVFVHRGIYEAAKGMYQQMLPEIHEHIEAHGARAKLRFTGHSLGGSLSLLVSLMLLVRGAVSLSALLPVITFGSPSIMCGGDKLLGQLGLPRSHVQTITMHRDIVPRAFSCSYPSHVVELLKAVNSNFRSHPCLNNQKLLYDPMGELIILQPDANFSPEHDLLPPGSGLYLLTCSFSDSGDSEKHLRAAKSVFLNSLHPLEILSDRSAYGNGGTILRDHDMNSYLKCVRSLIRHELNRIRKAKRERRRKVWWPLVSPRIRVVAAGSRADTSQGGQFNFSGMVRTGSESLKRFSRLVASQHMHSLVVLLLFPARLLLMGFYSATGGLS